MKKEFLLIFLMSFLFSSCYKEKDYEPAKVNADEVIVSLTATDPVITADGQSFTYILAELPTNAVDARSTVVFTTTKGTFDNNTKTISLAATLINDNNTNKRIAKVKLVSSTVIENADITATVSNVSKKIAVSFTNPAYDSFLSVSSSESAIQADGASTATITVEQPVNILSDYTSVTLVTTAGTFDNGTKTITKSSALVLVNGVYKRMAQVRITASKSEENANIEVAIKGTLKNHSISFQRAFPENIELSLSGASITTGFANSLQITTNLLRQKGIPTINNEATLEVVDTNNISRGILINYKTKSDASGQIINKLTLGTDTYKGVLKIIAKSKDALGNTITTENEILAQ